MLFYLISVREMYMSQFVTTHYKYDGDDANGKSMYSVMTDEDRKAGARWGYMTVVFPPTKVIFESTS